MITADVFKIQKPLATNSDHPTVLIYNQSRRIMFTQNYDKWWATFFGKNLKRYVWAVYDDTNGTFNVDRIVDDPDW